MESSEDDDDLPLVETIIPPSKIDSRYQSDTEKGIRKICCELLDLKDAVEDLFRNRRTVHLDFLRLSEEVTEMEHELVDLRRNISSHQIIVQDLVAGACFELNQWSHSDDTTGADKEPQIIDFQNPCTKNEEYQSTFLEKIDVLMAEHRVDEAIDTFEAESQNCTDSIPLDDQSFEFSFRSRFLMKKSELVNHFVEMSEQPSLGFPELKMYLVGLIRLGKSPLALELFLKSFTSRLKKNTDHFVHLCSLYPRTFPACLSHVMFPTLLSALNHYVQIFGDNPTCERTIVQWIEQEIGNFVSIVKQNLPFSETDSALSTLCSCIEVCLKLISTLESHGWNLLNYLIVLLQPHFDEVIDLNFRRARCAIVEIGDIDENMISSFCFGSSLSLFASILDSVIIGCGIKFLRAIEDILIQLTPQAVHHFGGNLLAQIAKFYDKYIERMIMLLPSPSDDDALAEVKDIISLIVETDSEQLALLGVAFTIFDELIPSVTMKAWGCTGAKEETAENHFSGISLELKDWKRQLQHSFDKLRDHFCRQYVLGFIYSQDGKTRLSADIYLTGGEEDLYWSLNPLPSLPFQALFAKLQQLSMVAGDVLTGKEKLQKNLLARLTETVLIWFSHEQEIWSAFEDTSVQLQPHGLQLLILDMRFTVEVSRFAGYPSRHIQQITSVIIDRAICTFSSRGIDMESALAEDEWFTDTSRRAINKLLLGASASEASEVEDEHIFSRISSNYGSNGSVSSLSTESVESFASADSSELHAP